MSLTKATFSMIQGAPVNVLDYIPAGTNTATTNCSAYIQAAINSLSTGGSIYVPAGEYLLTSTITFPAQIYLKFYGDGSLRTKFTFNGTGNAIEAASNTSNYIHVNMSGFLLQRTAGNTTATNGIYMRNCQYYSDLTDVFVDGFNKTGTQTIDGYTFYYSGILAMYCWGLNWTKVECRHNGNGMSFVNFNSTLVAPNCLVNTQHGAYFWDSVGTVVGGVFQGNDTANNSNAASVVANAEIICYGGAMTLDGVYFEGEGVNPPWTIIVDSQNATNRSYGTKIYGCNITRSTDTSRVRGCIYVRYAEETVIEANQIYPTAVDSSAAATVPHITLATVSLNTRIGHNSWKGRHFSTGIFYAWLPPIINTTNLPAYTYPYATSDGGIKTVQKRLRLDYLLPAASLTAPLSATYAKVPGTTLVTYQSLTRMVWLTNIQAILPAGLSAGTFTVKVYDREGDAGSPILEATATGTVESGVQFQMLNQHPYITLFNPGTVHITVETDASFAPTASNEIYVSLEFEEFDNH
jgi:hypothetical protein